MKLICSILMFIVPFLALGNEFQNTPLDDLMELCRSEFYKRFEDDTQERLHHNADLLQRMYELKDASLMQLLQVSIEDESRIV